MKIAFIALIAALSTACTVGAPRDTLPRACDATCQENVRLRKEVARLQQEKGQQPGAADRTTVSQGADVSTGAMWVRQQHGVYMGAVGTYPRQMSQGRKIQVNNLVCDDGSRDFVCRDRDRNGEPDYNTWLSFSIVGSGKEAPAICDSGFNHPALGVSLLPPNESCFVEVGAAPVVKVKIRFYRNNGNSSYVDLDSKSYKTITKIIEVPNGLFSQDIEEMTTSAY